MNLLGNFQKIKSFIKPGLIALIPVFLGCDTSEDAGTEFDLGSNVDVKLIEFEIPSTNVFIDSLRTDSENRILTGSYSDPLTGNFTAEGYFHFSYEGGGTLPTRTITRADTVTLPVDTLFYDSAILQLEVLQFLPGVSSNLAFDVFELQNDIQDLTYLSGTRQQTSSQVGSFSTPLTSILDSDGNPIKNEDSVIRISVRVKLPDEYSLSLFDQITSSIRDSTTSLLAETFTDFGLVPNSSSAMAQLSTFSPYSNIIFYMDDPEDDSVYSFTLPISGPEYTYLERDFSASAFSSILEKEDFDLPDRPTLLDPLTGLTTSFNIEGISTFFEENPNILINTAILTFNISELSSRDTLTSFRAYFRKQDGGFSGPGFLQSPFSNVIMADNAFTSSSGGPALSSLNSDSTKYLLTPTLFFQSLYNNYQNTNELVFVDPFFNDTISVSDLILVNPTQVTLQQAMFENSGIKLRVFYTEVN